MLGLIRRGICWVVILAVIFVALSLTTGGKWFRHFGIEAGKKSERAGDVADGIKRTVDGAVQKSHDAANTMKDLANRTSNILKSDDSGK